MSLARGWTASRLLALAAKETNMTFDLTKLAALSAKAKTHSARTSNGAKEKKKDLSEKVSLSKNGVRDFQSSYI